MRELPVSPSDILALGPEEADALLEQLERQVPVHAPFEAVRPGTAQEAIVFGDSHGDWRSTVAAVEEFSAPGPDRLLVGLGDYIDRAPEDCGAGSVANSLYLLSVEAKFPDRVLLLQGNHETSRRIGAIPHHLPEEVDQLWGPAQERYDRIMGLLERGPVAAATPSGVYLAHAGFPRKLAAPWTKTFDHLDDEALAEVVWAECDAARSRRGGARVWREADLEAFLSASDLSLMLRGHDPDLCGRPLYRGRCLTLHTTRIYERYGGVITARVPLTEHLDSIADLAIRHLSTEGQTYPVPP
jgi:hypothetical protein